MLSIVYIEENDREVTNDLGENSFLVHKNGERFELASDTSDPTLPLYRATILRGSVVDPGSYPIFLQRSDSRSVSMFSGIPKGSEYACFPLREESSPQKYAVFLQETGHPAEALPPLPIPGHLLGGQNGSVVEKVRYRLHPRIIVAQTNNGDWLDLVRIEFFSQGHYLYRVADTLLSAMTGEFELITSQLNPNRNISLARFRPGVDALVNAAREATRSAKRSA